MHTKRYLKEHLYSSRDELVERSSKITAFEKDVWFQETDRGWIRKSSVKSNERRVRRYQYKDSNLDLLSDKLDDMFGNGLVHGDIHPKNIVSYEGELRLIDFEIDLIQYVYGRWGLMVTQPYVALSDKVDFKVTSKTDFVCFAGLFNLDLAKSLKYDEERLQHLLKCKKPFKEILKNQ